MKDLIQEQLIATRKKQILDSAARIFAEKGFHSSTIKDIARAAGIADGTIYIYFKNKNELLFGIFEAMQAQILQSVPQEMPPVESLEGVLENILNYPLQALKGDNFELFRVIISEIMVNEELRQRYREQILQPSLALAEAQLRALAAEGLIKEEGIELSVRAISGMIMGLIMEAILGDAVLETQWDRLAAFLSTLLVNGLEKK